MTLPQFTTSELIGHIFGVVGCLLSYVLYRRSIRKPAPRYYVLPERPVLVHPLRSSDIQVFFRGQPITGECVFAVLIHFWNAGAAPIREVDVLEAFAIEVSDSARILDAKICERSRLICDFPDKLDIDSATNAIHIPFRILEKDDGILVSLTLAGDAAVGVRMTGVAVGAKQVQQHAPVPSKSRRILRRGVVVSLSLLAYMGLTAAGISSGWAAAFVISVAIFCHLTMEAWKESLVPKNIRV
jgi:hypothetical protein